MEKWFTEILFTEEQIRDKVKELASWVNKTYKNSKNLVLVGLLKGSIPFMAELMKSVTVNHSIDFMTVSSFGGGIKSSGNIKIVMDLKQDIFEKDILIVEDIVDSGLTLKRVSEDLKSRGPKTLKIITLLDKPEGRKIDFKVDKFGFVVPNKFLAGYGLDVKEKLRNAPFVGIFDQSKIDEL